MTNVPPPGIEPGRHKVARAPKARPSTTSGTGAHFSLSPKRAFLPYLTGIANGHNVVGHAKCSLRPSGARDGDTSRPRALWLRPAPADGLDRWCEAGQRIFSWHHPLSRLTGQMARATFLSTQSPLAGRTGSFPYLVGTVRGLGCGFECPDCYHRTGTRLFTRLHPFGKFPFRIVGSSELPVPMQGRIERVARVFPADRLPMRSQLFKKLRSRHRRSIMAEHVSCNVCVTRLREFRRIHGNNAALLPIWTGNISVEAKQPSIEVRYFLVSLRLLKVILGLLLMVGGRRTELAIVELDWRLDSGFLGHGRQDRWGVGQRQGIPNIFRKG